MSKYRPVAERVKDFAPVELRLEPGDLNQELARCQDCGVPFCHAAGCPLGNTVPEINAAALAGRWGTALANLLRTSPFPEFTARVCPALCEGSCVQSLNEQAVPCRLTEYEVIERGFARELVRACPPARRRDTRVAVVGSGPAGLAAAWKLNQAGFRVTVYEKDARAGGFLRYGIPDFKLEKSVIDRRVSLLEAEGVRFEYAVEAGRDISERLLRRRHDIVLLASGARNKRDLAVPGRQLRGIHFATDYLSAQNRLLGGELDALPAEYNARGKNVVVIGGGDTGSDCVGTAWRQGAASVRQIEIMPRPPVCRDAANPWPEWPRILRTSSSHEEGGERSWNVSTAAFTPAALDSGQVGGIDCALVEWTTANGRPGKPVPVQGSEFHLDADLVLLALGFSGVEDVPLLSDLHVTPDKAGRLPREPGGRLEHGLYACGDAATGASLVVRAIHDGLTVAETVIREN